MSPFAAICLGIVACAICYALGERAGYRAALRQWEAHRWR